MIEGSETRYTPLPSGSGSGRPKNMWIRWIRIRMQNDFERSYPELIVPNAEDEPRRLPPRGRWTLRALPATRLAGRCGPQGQSGSGSARHPPPPHTKTTDVTTYVATMRQQVYLPMSLQWDNKCTFQCHYNEKTSVPIYVTTCIYNETSVTYRYLAMSLQWDNMCTPAKSLQWANK